jgi:hypothetical protein
MIIICTFMFRFKNMKRLKIDYQTISTQISLKIKTRKWEIICKLFKFTDHFMIIVKIKFRNLLNHFSISMSKCTHSRICSFQMLNITKRETMNTLHSLLNLISWQISSKVLLKSLPKKKKKALKWLESLNYLS